MVLYTRGRIEVQRDAEQTKRITVRVRGRVIRVRYARRRQLVRARCVVALGCLREVALEHLESAVLGGIDASLPTKTVRRIGTEVFRQWCSARFAARSVRGRTNNQESACDKFRHVPESDDDC